MAGWNFGTRVAGLMEIIAAAIIVSVPLWVIQKRLWTIAWNLKVMTEDNRVRRTR